MDDYLARYDDRLVQPFAGVVEVLAATRPLGSVLEQAPEAGRAELARLGWAPEVALFSEAFDGPKRLQPVLDVLGLGPDEVVFIGDTAHDRRVATEVGATFGLAAWNPRAEAEAGDHVLQNPSDVLALLD